MKLLVCGGRVGIHQKAVEAVLDALAPSLSKPLTVIHGAARQTDSYAGAWARKRGHKEDAYPIDSSLDGATDDAPKMRNWRMAEQRPEAILAFPGGPGTRNMIGIGQGKKIPIWDVELDDGQFNVYAWAKSPKEKARLIASGSY
jgi:predicted Rossmann-fold nucleotide-binding protein